MSRLSLPCDVYIPQYAIPMYCGRGRFVLAVGNYITGAIPIDCRQWEIDLALRMLP